MLPTFGYRSRQVSLSSENPNFGEFGYKQRVETLDKTWQKGKE